MRFSLHRLRSATTALFGDWLRLLLSILALSFAAGGLCFSLSMPGSIRAAVQAASPVSNGFTLFPMHRFHSSCKPFSIPDYDALCNVFAGRAEVVSELQNVLPIECDRAHGKAFVVAPIPSILPPGWSMARGGPITREDEKDFHTVACISETLVHRLGLSDNAALHAHLLIDGIPFSVKGICDPAPYNALVPFLIIPRSVASQRLMKKDELGPIMVAAPKGTSPDALLQEAKALIRKRHALSATAPDDFYYSMTSQLYRDFMEVSRPGRLMAWFFTLAALILGLSFFHFFARLAFLAKRSEIGLKRAYGATKGHITLEMVYQSLIIAILAVTAGCAEAGGAAWAIRHYMADHSAYAFDWKQYVSISPPACGITFLMFLLAAVLLQLRMARSIFQWSPSEALR